MASHLEGEPRMNLDLTEQPKDKWVVGIYDNTQSFGGYNKHGAWYYDINELFYSCKKTFNDEKKAHTYATKIQKRLELRYNSIYNETTSVMHKGYLETWVHLKESPSFFRIDRQPKEETR